MTDLTVNSDPRHGSYSTYVNHGCRCDRCQEGQRRYYRANRDRIIAVSRAWYATHRQLRKSEVGG
jgi:hypothetical protein